MNPASSLPSAARRMPHGIRHSFVFQSEPPDASGDTEHKAPITEGSAKHKPLLLLIEDHPLMVSALQRDLENDYTIHSVHGFAGLQQALAQETYSAAILDLTFDKKMLGFEMMPLLRVAKIPVLIYSGTAQDWHIRAAVRADAKGFVDKSEGSEGVKRALQAIREGGRIFPAEILEELLTHYSAAFPALGPAQQALIDCCIASLTAIDGIPSNKTLGAQMSITPERVRNTLYEIRPKFAIESSRREDLFIFLSRWGYFPGVTHSSMEELGWFAGSSKIDSKN